MNPSKRDHVTAKIETLDLTLLLSKLMDPEGNIRWGKDKAEEAIFQYKRFLHLTRKYPDKRIVPSEEIDEVWHLHILDTHKYVEDCNQIFGHYLHHVPEYPTRASYKNRRISKLVAESEALFLKEFNESPYQLSDSSVEFGQSELRGKCTTYPSCNKCHAKCHAKCSKCYAKCYKPKTM